MASLFLAAVLFLFVVGLLVPDEPVSEIKKDITLTDDMKENDNGTVVITVDNLEIELDTVTDEDKTADLSDESKGDYVSGTTKDGATFEGRGDTIYTKKGDTTVKATVKKNKDNKDAGKVAGVVSAVTQKAGYDKNRKNWNSNYAIHYIEKAECLLYYPAQLTYDSKDKDGTLYFRDPASKATMTVSLSPNSYSCMDEIERELKDDAGGMQVLASGTDWYSAESYSENNGNKFTLFSLYGFGEKYQVSVQFNYEDRYSFAFTELRSLIKCKFIEGGVWVSNAMADTEGKVVEVLRADPAVYNPELIRTSQYMEELGYVFYYPDIFSKFYISKTDDYCFDDPHTGAVLVTNCSYSDISSVAELQELMRDKWGYFETSLYGENGCEGWKTEDGQDFYTRMIYRDGCWYYLNIRYPKEYAKVYKKAWKMMEIALPGDGESTTEMKDIFFPAFSCNITVPLQFVETETDGDVHIFTDSLNNLEMRLTFTEITDPSECENLYNMFHVAAKDRDVSYGEYYVKWHNKNGAFIGAVGSEYACLMELPYPNAYSVYELSWDRFAINFSDEKEYETPADRLRKDVAEKLDQEPEYVNNKPTPIGENKQVYSSLNEKLLEDDSSLYSQLPFHTVSNDVTCVGVGEITAFTFNNLTDSGRDRLEECVNELENMGFTIVEESSYEENTCWFIENSAGSSNDLPDMKMVVDTDYGMVMYFLEQDVEDYSPGTLNFDYSSMFSDHSEAGFYSDYIEIFNMLMDLFNGCGEEDSCMDRYFRLSYREHMQAEVDDDLLGYDDMDFDDFDGYAVEYGHLENGDFIMDYYDIDFSVIGHFRIYTDGHTEVIDLY